MEFIGNSENCLEVRQDVSSVMINDESVHSFTLLRLEESGLITVLSSCLNEILQNYITYFYFEQLLKNMTDQCRSKIKITIMRDAFCRERFNSEN